MPWGHLDLVEDCSNKGLRNLFSPPRVFAACAPAQLRYGATVTLGQTAGEKAVWEGAVRSINCIPPSLASELSLSSQPCPCLIYVAGVPEPGHVPCLMLTHYLDWLAWLWSCLNHVWACLSVVAETGYCQLLCSACLGTVGWPPSWGRCPCLPCCPPQLLAHTQKNNIPGVLWRAEKDPCLSTVLCWYEQFLCLWQKINFDTALYKHWTAFCRGLGPNHFHGRVLQTLA